MCGEKWGIKQVSKHQDGSPPRVRGEAFPFCDYSISLRITPACAGRSCQTRPTCGFRRDHPRVCGEKLYRIASASAIRGSPPRVRGEATLIMVAKKRKRITPACAGRSGQAIFNLPDWRDHPRVCGEKSPSMRYSRATRGSPPRARGEEYSPGGHGGMDGITPACAGRSNLYGQPEFSGGDHPRVRGEKG